MRKSLMKDRSCPVMLGLEPDTKQAVGIRSRTLGGYDLYLMESDMSGLYAWIHFCNRESVDDLIGILQEIRTQWESDEKRRNQIPADHRQKKPEKKADGKE